MKYYKVKPESDQRNCYNNGQYVGCLLENELLTEKELLRKGLRQNSTAVYPVEVSKRKVMSCFGKRIELK